MKKPIIGVMGLFLVVFFGLAGCGGGSDAQITSTVAPVVTTATTQTVKKISIVDGNWRIVSDGSWRTGPMPTDVWADPLKLAAYYWLRYEDGTVIATSSPGNTMVQKSGTFVVENGALDNTFTNFYAGSGPILSVADILAGKGGAITSTTRIINEKLTANVTVSGNSMVWKDNSGNTIATFTK